MIFIEINTINARIMKKTIIIIAGIFLSLIGLNGQNSSNGYKIIQKISLQGDGFWDYLNADDATGMLYVSHGKMVNVVDMSTGKSIATITDVNGAMELPLPLNSIRDLLVTDLIAM